MIRTSLYLDNECYQYLQLQRNRLGKTISELVREMIHVTMNKDVKKISEATDRIYGLWEDRQSDVDEYIREMRRDRIHDHD